MGEYMGLSAVITKVGNTGRAARVRVDGRTFNVRTTSRRRYVVVDIGGNIGKRTDNLATAQQVRSYAAARGRRVFIIDWLQLDREGEVTVS